MTATQAARGTGGDTQPEASAPLDMESLTADFLREVAAPTGDTPPETTFEEELDPDALPEPEDEEEVAGDAADQPPPEEQSPARQQVTPQVAKWAENVLKNPRRIHQVPRHILPDVHALSVEMTLGAYVQGAEQVLAQVRDAAYQQGVLAGKQSVVYTAEGEELDRLAEQDPTEFARIAREEPQRVARWSARKSEAASGLPTIREAARAELQRVAGDPVATAFLQRQEQADPRRYSETPQGLENLRRDVSDALVESRVQARAQSPDPSASAAQRRQEASARRKELPRPDIGTNGSGGGAKALPNDLRSLTAMVVEDERKRR